MLITKSLAALSFVAVTAAACGGGGDDGSQGDDQQETHDPGGPTFLSFGVNRTTLTSNQQMIVVTAVLTDPDGVDDIVGGSLTDDTGATLGAFATSAQEGAYSITLDWDTLVAGRADVPGPINTPLGIHLTGTFFDQAGHQSTHGLDVTVDCGDDPNNLSVVGPRFCEAMARCADATDIGRFCDLESTADAPVTGAQACDAAFGTTCAECYDNERVAFSCDAAPPALAPIECFCN